MTTEEAIAWIAELFNEVPNDIAPETPREDILEWDSIGVLNLMAELDTKFGIMLSESEISGMVTVSDLLEILRKHQKIS